MIPSLRARAGLALLLGLAACQAESQDGTQVPTPPAAATRVLFIGNSLTFYNELPSVVARLAREAGDTSFAVQMVAMPNYSLDDHLADGTAARALQAGWTHVVLQQGPSSLPESGVALVAATERIAPSVRAAGAEPILYMVWPDRSRLFAFDAVRTHYRDAAAAVDGIFAPAGDAWALAFEADSTMPLYGMDDFHPSVEGTWLAAVVLLARIRGVDPLALAPSIPGSSLSAARVRMLQRAAAAALARNPARP